MSINPLIAGSMVIAALTAAPWVSAQNRPPIGATVWNVPSGAVDQGVNGVTDFAYGCAYYGPIYSGSGVYYEVVTNPA